MRNPYAEQPSLFSHSQTEDFEPADPPLRRIRTLADDGQEAMLTRSTQGFPLSRPVA